MTSIAYHQYCNISYNGGSYVCSPIKGPLSTSQTPGTIENKNRGITYAQNGQPVKDANSNNESSNSQDRRMFKEMVITVPGRLQQKLMGAYDASERSSLLRTIAVGTSGFNKANQALSFKSVHVQDSNRALNKLRRVGGAVPPKVQAKILPPPTSVANVRDNTHLQKQSKNSPNVKLSVFMPRHLRSRIECTTECNGGEIEIDNNNNNASGTDAVTGSEEATSYENLKGMNTLVVGKDNDGNNAILINNTNSPILTNTRNTSTSSKQYGLAEGKYLFSNVDKDHAFTILNHNKEDFIRIIGDDDKMLTKKVQGITYTFYYGDVILDVIDNFGIVSIYTYNYGYAGGEYGIVYGEHFKNTHVNGIVGFEKDGNSVVIDQDEENATGMYFRFVNFIQQPNNYPTNLERQHFGLGIGTYTIIQVPQDLAFTILNNGLEHMINIISELPDSNDPILSRNVNGKDYTFHYGTVTIQVLDDFSFMDLAVYSQDIKGEKYIFKYSPEFSLPSYSLGNTETLVESDDTTLPPTLYGYKSIEHYTFYGYALIIRPLNNVDVNKFTKFTIEPELPGWLTFNQGNGYITGYTINPDDAFYLKQYIVTAYLSDGKIKKYPILFVVFNQESVVNSDYCNYSAFVKTPENKDLFPAYDGYLSNVPNKSFVCAGASMLPPNTIVVTGNNEKTVTLNKYSATTIWAYSDQVYEKTHYPLGKNIIVKAPSNWTIYVGEFVLVGGVDDNYTEYSEPIKEINTGKETITDFIDFMYNYVDVNGALTYPLTNPPRTYRVYAKKN